MSFDFGRTSNLTYKVDLPGGQRRLREAILYVCGKCVDANYFGLVKLNKILWWADFTSFSERGQPVTGRMYQRQNYGPVPVEMKPLLDEMQRRNEISISPSRITDIAEQRPKALVEPVLKDFSQSDIDFFDRAVRVFWNCTGTEASDRSHGFAWKTRENGDPMAYELAYISDEPLGPSTLGKLGRIAKERGWSTH